MLCEIQCVYLLILDVFMKVSEERLQSVGER